jgi:exonuclease III
MNIGYDFDGVITKNVLDTNILGERHEDIESKTTLNYMIIDKIKKQLKNDSKIFIISKNNRDKIKKKLQEKLLSYLFDDKNIYANLHSKVDIIKKLNIKEFYDDSVDNIHEINTILRKQQQISLDLFLVKPEQNKIIKIENDNYRVITYNTNWKNMFATKDAPNPLCRKDNVIEGINSCATNVVNLIKNQLPLDFIFIQEAITPEFDILKDTFEFIITQSGPEKIYTLINKIYDKPLKIIPGEFEEGRPFHIIVLDNMMTLINVHFGHNKNIKKELSLIKKELQKEFNKKLIKKMRIIMAGDFNMYIKDLPRFLNKDYKKTKTKGTCCISGQKFNFIDKSVLRSIYNMKNIDYIFDSDNDIIYSITLFPFDKSGLLLPASDHLAVFAELKK